MGARRTGRERALQALYQLEQDATVEALTAVDAAWSASDEPKEADAHSFALELVAGVKEHRAALDELIEKTSTNWRVDRMTRIDRNVLRLGAFEIVHRADIPRKVAINEAIELAKKFGNEDSASFINGLLDRIASAVNKA